MVKIYELDPSVHTFKEDPKRGEQIRHLEGCVELLEEFAETFPEEIRNGALDNSVYLFLDERVHLLFDRYSGNAGFLEHISQRIEGANDIIEGWCKGKWGEEGEDSDYMKEIERCRREEGGNSKKEGTGRRKGLHDFGETAIPVVGNEGLIDSSGVYTEE